MHTVNTREDGTVEAKGSRILSLRKNPKFEHWIDVRSESVTVYVHYSVHSNIRSIA